MYVWDLRLSALLNVTVSVMSWANSIWRICFHASLDKKNGHGARQYILSIALVLYLSMAYMSSVLFCQKKIVRERWGRVGLEQGSPWACTVSPNVRGLAVRSIRTVSTALSFHTFRSVLMRNLLVSVK